MYITRDRFIQANFQRKLDPIAKNVIRNQNLLELVFKIMQHFDVKNPVIGSLIQEIDIRKKDVTGKRLAKAPNIKDFEIKYRLDRLTQYNNKSI